MAPDTPESAGRLVLVFTAPSIPAGLVARALLESNGIPVMAKGESEGPYRVGPVYLMVPQEHEDEARRLLQEAEREGWAAEDGQGTS
jgi:putative signal transducing protein